MRLRAVAAISAACTYLFFLEYLPPVKRVHIPFDLEGYHYSLADYAFQSVKHGRFPEWDAAIYCGQSFAGNIQAALFYPPTWLLFAAKWNHPRLSYQSLEEFMLLHVWLAFLLCYAWLSRTRRLGGIASALGAGVFAFSGYMLLQLQHLGQAAGYAWMPLGLWGIDQAIDQRRWQPLSKLAAASALIFLAGYPPLWFVFAMAMGVYALARSWRWTPAVVAALAVSLGLAAVQLLPTWELHGLKGPDEAYGEGIKDPAYFISYFAPNYFNFGMDAPAWENYGKEYLYLGAPGILGLALVILRRRNWRAALPFAAILTVSLIALTNPFNAVASLIHHWPFLPELCRSWTFLAGISLASAALAALGLEDFLRVAAPPLPRLLLPFSITLLLWWSLWELWRWVGPGFPHGWTSALDAAVTLAIFALSLYTLRTQSNACRITLAILLLVSVAIDYKVFGTSKRFNAATNAGQETYSGPALIGMDPAVYGQLRAYSAYRVLVDRVPFPLQFRHIGLRTPQGFDPFLSTQFREALGAGAGFRSAWEFDIDPDQTALIELLGVRYFITSDAGPLYPRIRASPNFVRLGSSSDFFKVFEYRHPRLPYGFEDGAGEAASAGFAPERRDFQVRSPAGGRFYLVEQIFPGWRATVDGRDVPIERWRTAFMSIAIPPGEHDVRFEFHSTGLRIGAWISLATLLGMAGALLLSRRGG
jgi:hypothetical protein